MKKIACLLLSLALVLGMGVTAFAMPEGWEIDSFDEDNFWLDAELQQGEISSDNYQAYWDSGFEFLDLGTIRPGEELRFLLDAENMLYEGPDGEIYDFWYVPEIMWYDLSARDWRNAGLQASVRLAAASRLVDGKNFRVVDESFLEFEDNVAIICIPFIEEFVSTEELDFEFIISLKLRDDPFRREVHVTGTMENPVIQVEASHEYVDLSDGSVAEPNDFVENIEVDLGNGVSIFTKMFKGKLFYGTAARTDDEKDDVVFRQYPDIDNILHLNVVGLNSTGDVVKLATDYAKYHVYDKDFNYLGTADQMLPFSSTYYLANKLLDIESVDEEAEEELSDDEPVDE